MTDRVHRFRVGTIQCTAIVDGTFTYAPPMFPPPAVALFANAPRDQLEQVLRGHSPRPDHQAEWTSTYTCLVINTEDHVVLVDSGAGDLAPTTGRLREHMSATGLSFDDIDTVVTTHAHPDHIGGNTTPEGRPAFPKARYLMSREEWDFWTSEQAERELGEHMAVPLQIARRHLSLTREQLELIDGETEIVPGVDAIPAPGHTPGHLALMVSSMGHKLLILSDTVLHPVHLERPEWHAVFDFDPPKVVSTRRSLLGQAAADKALVFAFHFPFPGLGYVSPKGEGWEWQATEATV